MNKMDELLEPNDDLTLCGDYFSRGSGYDFRQIIETDDDEVIITAKIRIKAKTKSGIKILNTMTEKQTSPLETMIKKIERENKTGIKEGKEAPMYPSLNELFE